VNPEGLDDETGHDDPEQQQERDGVIRRAVGLAPVGQAVGPGDVAAMEGHQDADQDGQAEEVHREGEDQVEPPAQEGDAEGLRDVKLRRVEGGAEDQDHESEEDQPVHDAGIGVLEGLDLQEAVAPQQLQALLRVVPPDLGLAHGRPHLPAAVDAIGEDAQGDKGEQKEPQFKMLGIPEDLPSFIAHGKRDVLHNSSRKNRL